jgi:hypothetical protein
MTSTVGWGLALIYIFPGGGPILTVRVCELFSSEMRDVIRFYTLRYGIAAICEPTPAVRSAAA